MDISTLSDADLNRLIAAKAQKSTLSGMTDEELNRAIAAKSAPSYGASVARDLGLGTRATLEGIASVPAMINDAGRAVLNAPSALYNALPSTPIEGMDPEQMFADAQRAAPYPFPTPTNAVISRGLDTLGMPTPETSGERVRSDVVRNVAGLIPTMGAGAIASEINPASKIALALMDKPVSQIAGAAGAGAASGITREEGGGPVAQTLAGLTGGVAGAGAVDALSAAGRMGAAALQPFTQAGREQIAADALLRGSSDPATLRQRLVEGIDDVGRRLPDSPVSTGTAARDPGLMVIEQGLRSDVGTSPGQAGMSGAAAFRDLDARRNAARLNALQGMADDLTPDARGAATRSALQDQLNQTKGSVSRIYNAIDPEGTTAVPVYDIGRGMFDAAAKRYGPGGGELPQEAQAVLDEIRSAADAGKTVNFDWLQNVRSRLGNAAGMAAQQRDNRAASTYGDMRQALEDAVNNAIGKGNGFTPEQQSVWSWANAARRDMGERFGRDDTGANIVGQIVKKDAFGAPIMQDANVPARAIASPANVRQVLRAAGPQADQVRQTLRGQFVDAMLRRAQTTGSLADAQGNVSTALSPAAFTRYMRDNGEVAGLLFDPNEQMRLQRIAADFNETQTAATTARARGSDTAQNLSVGNFIARATNGLVNPNEPGAQTMASLGGILRLVYSAPEAATREIILHAASDPQFANLLLQRATPQSVQRASDYLNRTMLDRVTSAAQSAAVRLGARTGNALATRP